MSRVRVSALEGLRGIASILVLAHHFILGFSPRYHGILAETNTDKALVGTIYFALINGTGAVVLFFVLSGFVLTRRFFMKGSMDGLDVKFVSRFPRLAVPILCSLILSYCLFNTGAMKFSDAAQISGSDWLSKFAYGGLDQQYKPSIVEVFQSGLWDTLVLGKAYLNTNLWTMKVEYWGSLFVFAITLLILHRDAISSAAILVFSLLIASSMNSYLVPFIAGVAISRFDLRIASLPLAAASLFAGLYLFGYFYDDDTISISPILRWMPN